jgi:hypothetical protein
MHFAKICGFLWAILPERRLGDVFLAQICANLWSCTENQNLDPFSAMP